MNTETAVAPDIISLDVPMDAWTQPFWDYAAREELRLPHCGDCGHFRWPPGPFCPRCRSQSVTWVPSGEGRIYSFTIVRQKRDDEEPRIHVPALIEFPQAGGLRLVAAIADTPLEVIRIGAAVKLSWSQAANAAIPIFQVT